MRQTTTTHSAPRVALVLVDTGTDWGRSIIRGAHAACRVRAGWRLRLERAERLRRGVLGVDGIIARVADGGLEARLAATGVPVVNVSAVELGSRRFPRVATDVEAAGRMAAEYFLERGFRSFGYLSMIGSDYVKRQRRAFVAALKRSGFACASLALEGGGGLRGRRSQELALRAWLASLPKPAAIFSWSGGSEFLDACRAAGLSVPEEVAFLSGSDDDLLCEVSEVPISAVRQPAEQIGTRALELLARLIEGEEPGRVEHRLAPLSIVTRQSTDILAVEDRTVALALRLIRERWSQPIQVSDLAAETGVSRRILERRTAKALGSSPGALLRRERLRHARQLLARTDLPVSEIAAACGFGSPEYFIQAFRSAEGYSPAKYRRTLLGRRT